MNLLFDTQALIAWIMGKRFRPSVKRVIEKPNTNLFLSVVTPWEMALKPQLRRFGITAERIWNALDTLGGTILPVTKAHVEMHVQLPFHEDHRDPFDRMLIAQALVENLTIVGADTRFELYPELKVLW